MPSLKSKRTEASVLAVRSIPAPSFQGLFSLEDLPQGTLLPGAEDEYPGDRINRSNYLRRTINYDTGSTPPGACAGGDREWSSVGYPVLECRWRTGDPGSAPEQEAPNFTKKRSHEIVDIEKRLNLLKVPSGEYVVEVHTREDSWRDYPSGYDKETKSCSTLS